MTICSNSLWLSYGGAISLEKVGLRRAVVGLRRAVVRLTVPILV